MIGKMLTAQIKEDIYYSVIRRELLPDEDNNTAWRPEEQELLYIDQKIVKESKMRRKNVLLRGMFTERHTTWFSKTG